MTIPDYLQTAYDNYKQASTDLKDFREEVGSVLETNEEMTRNKTRLKNTLTNSVLKYKSDNPEVSNDLFDETVTVYEDDEFQVLDETQAVLAILQFCQNYKDQTGVDLSGSFLKILVGEVKERILRDPPAFGLVDISQAGVKHWYSPAFEIKRVKKVRVANSV